MQWHPLSSAAQHPSGPPWLAQEAERLHREVLAVKLATLGASSVSTGTTYNSLGRLLKQRGALEEAETMLRAALQIREARPAESHDAAITRDELGCVLQAAGRTAEAREMRLRRGRDGLICSNPPCSKSARQAGAPLKACARCGAVWYCGRDCQHADWAASHKRVCTAQAGAD